MSELPPMPPPTSQPPQATPAAFAPPLLGYADRVDSATMSPGRRFLRTAKAGGMMLLAALGWMVVAVIVSQLIVRGVPSAMLATGVAAILAVVTGACLRTLHVTRGRRVLGYVAQGVRLALPLPEFLRAAATAEHRPVSSQLTRLAGSIAAGTRLGDALRNEVPELPVRTANIVRVAADNRALDAALARLVAEHEPTMDDAFRRRFPWLYFGVLMVLLPLVCTMLAVFVLPKFSQILQDFGAPRPWWMSGYYVGDPLLGLLAFVLFVVGLVVVLELFAMSFRWILFARHDLDHPFRSGAERATWWMPVVGPLVRDRNHADLCQAIADGLAARRPADVVIAEAAMLDLNAVVLDRVRLWRSMVLAGKTLGAAARVAGFPSVIADLAGDHADPTRAADAFGFLARHYRARVERRRDWIAGFAVPLIALAAGTVVGAIAYGLFDAMQRIIDHSMPYKVGI